jgi:hypothetical protein
MCFICFASVQTNAQRATGFTDLTYDDFTNTVTAYSETDTDYDIGGDYTAYVSLVVRDDSYSIVASGSQRDDAGDGFASVTLQFPGSPDTTYTGIGTHKLYAYFYDDYWDYDYYPYRRVYNYYDNWYFGYFSGLGINYPWYYSFFSPTYAYRLRSTRPISLGTTHSSDSATTPGVSINITPSQTVKDGETASLSVTVNGDTPSAYQWGFTAPRGAANSPQVNFSAATSDSTSVTAAHWFAYPDDPCPPPVGNANFNAPYTISCVVTLSNGKKKTLKTTLTVNASWNPAGETPNPSFTGYPAIAFDSSNNLFYVQSAGNVTRNTPVPTINPASTSQFYDKTLQHENKHVQQYVSGSASDLYTVSGLMAVLSPLTDSTQAGLEAQINQNTLNYYASQGNILNARRSQLEKEAYAVSDSIAPKYLYQNCGRF